MKKSVLLLPVLFFFLLPLSTALAEGDDGLGRAVALFSAENAQSAQCDLGLVAAEAVRLNCGTDIAIVCGGDLHDDLPAGAITRACVAEIFSEDKTLAVAEITPAQLKELLENCLSHLVIDLENGDCIDREGSTFAAYPQLAGLYVRCDATALPGDRVRQIRLGETTLDLDDQSTLLTLAATEELLSGQFGGPVLVYTETNITLSQAFLCYAGRNETLEKLPSTFTEVGSGDANIAGSILPGRAAGVLLLAFVLAFGVIRSRNRSKTEQDDF